METKLIIDENQKKEDILLFLIQDFFDCRKLSEHLIFLDYWAENVLTNQQHKKYLNASDLLFFSNQFLNLLTACNEINISAVEMLPHFEESLKIPEDFIKKEQKKLIAYPNYLRTKEICNPLLVFQSIFKNNTINFYKTTIQDWVNEGLSSHYEPENAKLIFPTYNSLKKMVEACWLIHERSISKNTYQLLYHKPLNFDFSLSCPLLLSEEQLINPYLMVESFFSFAGINEYREDLTQWFKAALNENTRFENPNDLLFIHNQFTQLIHAGFLIGATQMAYVPEANYSTSYATLGHWLLAKMDDDYLKINPIQNLSPHFSENPINYLNESLTFNHIIKIRQGLKEWLEAALSKNTSIAVLDHVYIFDQFEELQKILEALFLLIVQPALSDKSQFNTNIN